MRQKRGFTLIELLAVMVILVVLAGLAMARILPKTEEVKRQAALADIEANLALALDLYGLENGGYPTTEQGLQALRTQPTTPPVPEKWKGPYLKKGLPKDPWGRPYQYRYPGEFNKEDYDLYSYGADGVEGGGDDIANWETTQTP
jgi:general secretion pathway protein G